MFFFLNVFFILSGEFRRWWESLYKNDGGSRETVRSIGVRNRTAMYARVTKRSRRPRHGLPPWMRCISFLVVAMCLRELVDGPRGPNHLTAGRYGCLSGDARVRVRRLFRGRQSHGEVRVQNQVADAADDTLRVSASCCPHDVWRSTCNRKKKYVH